MEIVSSRFDGGKAFDWGRTSADYARFRDIYPEEFYRKITDRGLALTGQKALDIGTGTGVLPRNLYSFGADWIGTDLSENQILQARRLAQEAGMEIDFRVCPTEALDFPDSSFDLITACQCFCYFDQKKVMPNLCRMLKPDGRLLILYMAWLPEEDPIAGQSEQLVLQYSPRWTGAGERRSPITPQDAAFDSFEPVSSEVFDLQVPFTRESWHGRMRACRGVGASLSPDELAAWDRDHRALLEKIAPERFTVLHYAALAELRPKK